MRRVIAFSMRRTAGGLVAIMTAATATLALATPAEAAVINVTATCSGGGVVVDNDYVAAGLGDIIVLANATGVTVTLANKTGVTGGASLPNGNATNLTLTAASGSFDIVGAAGCNAFAADVTFGPVRSSGLPPVIQQFGKPASGTCDTAAPVTLNWGGAGSGGWGESWAQWMNNGNGGAVCTRTLVYSNNLGAWTVG